MQMIFLLMISFISGSAPTRVDTQPARNSVSTTNTNPTATQYQPAPRSISIAPASKSLTGRLRSLFRANR